MTYQGDVGSQSRYPLVHILKRLQIGDVHRHKECLLEGVVNSGSSFQNLVNSLQGSQGQNASANNAPSLQSFLQNLLQNMNSVHNISGAVVSTQA